MEHIITTTTTATTTVDMEQKKNSVPPLPDRDEKELLTEEPIIETQLFLWRDIGRLGSARMLSKLNVLFDEGWRFKYKDLNRETQPIVGGGVFKVTLYRNTPVHTVDGIEDLSKLSKVAELRAYASEHDLIIPDNIKQALAIKKFIKGSLTK